MMNMTESDHDNPVRALRKAFFAYRNGIVADKLRNAGDPHAMIMGCLLADIIDITGRARADIGNDDELMAIAQELWNDTNSRECRLAAPMLFPPQRMTQEMALQWCSSVETTEISDNLCHKLLRNMPHAAELFPELIAQERVLTKHTGYRLLLNLLLMDKVQPTASLKDIIQADAQEPMLASLIKDILEEF